MEARPEETVFYTGGPTVGPEPGEDDWFEFARMGRTEAGLNNDLRGDDDRDTEVEQP